MICPWWSHVGCFESANVCLPSASDLQGVSVLWSHWALRWGWLVDNSHGPSFYPFLKGCNIPFLPVTGDFPWLPWLFRYDGEWNGNCISQFPQHPGMHLIGSHGFVYVQGPQMVSSLIFCDSEGNFIPPVPALKFRNLRDVKSDYQWKWGKKTYWVRQPCSCQLSLVLLSCLWGQRAGWGEQ